MITKRIGSKHRAGHMDSKADAGLGRMRRCSGVHPDRGRVQATAAILKLMRGSFVGLAVGISLIGSTAVTGKPFPMIGGDIRPAVIPNGDGSAITGGLDGTGRGAHLGHIRWTTWSSKEAVGWGVEWARCIDARGCPRAYTLPSRRQYRITATRPVKGVFTRLIIGRTCLRFGVQPSVLGYGYVSCLTWRTQ
jgi:hypothetical protein